MRFKTIQPVSIEMVKKVTNRIITVDDKDLLWLPKNVFTTIQINKSEQNDYKRFLVIFYAGRWVNRDAIVQELNEKMDAYFDRDDFFKVCKNSCEGYLDIHFNHIKEYWPGEPEVEIEIHVREVGDDYVISAKRTTKELKTEYQEYSK